MSATAQIYTPFETPYRMTMGLMALQTAEWLEIDDALGDDLREKQRLLRERHDQVFVELPDSRPAQQELLDLLVQHLLRHHGDRYERVGDALRVAALGEEVPLSGPEMAPLERAARLVQEDLCLMEPAAGSWRLSAGAVCFPTRWDLGSKLGQALDRIHDPVPGFRERLARPVGRFFDHLKVARPVWRLNWSLMDDPALFQPGGHGRKTANPALDGDNAGEAIWLRVERQTLRLLPGSGAIVFTIRIHRWPLRVLADRPEAARRLRQAIDTMPEALQQYKSVPVLGAAVRDYLDGIAPPDDRDGDSLR